MSLTVPEFSRLLSTLNQTKTKKSDEALYEFLKALLLNVRNFSKDTAAEINDNPAVNLLNEPFLLAGDPLPLLPLGRNLLAGLNVTFDDSVDNERTVNATGSTSSTGGGLILGMDGNDGQDSFIPGLTGATGSAGAAGAAGIGVPGSDGNDGDDGLVGLPTLTIIESIGAGFDGAGFALAVGTVRYVYCPFSCVILSVTMLADIAGAVVVDIWKDTYGAYPPVVGDSITAAALPTIAATNIKSQDVTLTGWNRYINAGDTLAFNVNSCTTITTLTIQLSVLRN